MTLHRIFPAEVGRNILLGGLQFAEFLFGLLVLLVEAGFLRGQDTALRFKLFQAGQRLDVVGLEIGGCRLICGQFGVVLFLEGIRMLCGF